MKKGISLIVLVITIIVMIIIAGAIIISLNSSNVTGKANWATVSSDRANLQAEFAVVLADVMVADADDINKDGIIDLGEFVKATEYTTWKAKVTAAGFYVVGDTATDTDPAAISVVYRGSAISGAPTTATPTWYLPGTASAAV